MEACHRGVRGPVPSSADRGQLAATAADPVADVLTRFRAAGSALTVGAGKIRGAPAGGAPYVACFYRSRSVCEAALVRKVRRAVVGVVWPSPLPVPVVGMDQVPGKSQ